MKNILLAIFAFTLPGLVSASGGGDVHLDKANVDINDQASLQNGAKLFVNYCLSCHSANYQRYNRMGADLGLTDKQVADNLMFASDKVGSTMQVAINPDDAKGWFGVLPPDLSVIARARGADWLYTYLRTFYLDDSKPTGVNNAVFADVGMPHVLWELQGIQKAKFKTVTDHDGNESHVIDGYEIVAPGSMSVREYNQASRDLTNFLVYMGEPAQLARTHIGWWVLFLVFLFIVAYAMKKEYWKDIH